MHELAKRNEPPIHFELSPCAYLPRTTLLLASANRTEQLCLCLAGENLLRTSMRKATAPLPMEGGGSSRRPEYTSCDRRRYGKALHERRLSQPIPRRRSLSASCSLAALLNCRNTTVSAYVMRFGPDSFVKWSGNAPAFESSYKKRNACREMRSTRNQMVTCCECPPAARGKSLYKAPASRAKTLLREGQYANGGSDASRTLWTTSTRRSNLLPATTPLLFTTQSGP